MTRTFNRIRKQVEDRKAFHVKRRGIHVAIHDLQVYLLELKTFHVKQLGDVPQELLKEHEKDILAAGEELEKAVQAWLA